MPADIKWASMIEDLTKFLSKKVVLDDVKSIDWCYREVARLGYRMSVTFMPIQEMRKMRMEGIGVPFTEEEEKRFGDGKYSYQLSGEGYESHGRHNVREALRSPGRNAGLRVGSRTRDGLRE